MLWSSAYLKLREIYLLLTRLQVTAIPSSSRFPGGSWTATAAMAEETAARLLLHQLKTVSLNTKAATSVATQLDSVLVTETGTETTGSLTISGEEYVFLVDMFVQSLETNLAGSSILTLSHSISNVATTLTEEQVTLSVSTEKTNCCQGDLTDRDGHPPRKHPEPAGDLHDKLANRVREPDWRSCHREPDPIRID